MNYETIKPYIEKGLVSEGTHPEHEDLRIFNYTQVCQFSKAWDEVTKNCRGLIMNVKTGEVVARPFPKFFNYEEWLSMGEKVPAEAPLVFEKLDGSLGILYWIGDVPWIATRGSFVSDQAKWATEWFRANADFSCYDREFTYLFEIIYPENRIVVSYDFSGLVLIAERHTEKGFEVPPDGFTDMAVGSAARVPFESAESLKATIRDNFEGFVLLWPDDGFRLKVKLAEYVRLHKIITGISEIGIWEHISAGKPTGDLLQKVPDEFFRWVESVEFRLRGEFAKIWGDAQMAYQLVHGQKSRKEKAIWITENAKPVAGVVFSLLDDQHVKAAQQVWKMVRPHGARNFKIDIDS